MRYYGIYFNYARLFYQWSDIRLVFVGPSLFICIHLGIDMGISNKKPRQIHKTRFRVIVDDVDLVRNRTHDFWKDHRSQPDVSTLGCFDVNSYILLPVLLWEMGV